MQGGISRKLIVAAFFALSLSAFGNAEEDSSEKKELFSEENTQKISKTFGHMVKKSVDRSTIPLQIEWIMQGMRDAMEGKEPPLTQGEYEALLTKMQQIAFLDRANKNFQEARTYLDENKKKKGVVSLDDDLVQYEIIKQGSGDVVSEETLVLMHYVGKYANGNVFSDSQKMTKEPIEINMDQTIPGLKTGISGMKVGEQRRVFIHPDRGYGMGGQLEPNALLIFDIDVQGVKPKPEKTEEDGEEEIALDDDFDDDVYTGFDEEIEKD